MALDDPWRDPERQQWLLGLEAVFGVDHLFQQILHYHLMPDDPESLAPDRPGHAVIAAIGETIGPLLALWDSDIRGGGFAESLGDDVAGLALAHARVLHEGGGPVDVDTVWDWAYVIERGGWVSGPVLQGFLFTAVELVFADPPAPLRKLFTDPPPGSAAAVPGPVREARRAVAGLQDALVRHHGPLPASSSVVVQARSFDRQWRDLVRSYPDEGRI